MTAVLVGLEDAAGFDARGCDGYVGTSAGSIVGAGWPPESSRARGSGAAGAATGAGPELAGERGLFARASSSASPRAAPSGRRSPRSVCARPRRAGRSLRRAALSRVPAGRRSLAPLGRELERAGARWDGRLSVSAVEVESGRRVMFGTPDAPRVSVGAAVEASCAIPGVFRPVGVNGRSYVDGGALEPDQHGPGARRPWNARPVPQPDGVDAAEPRATVRRARPGVALARRGRGARTERRGARVTTISPDAGSLAAMGPISWTHVPARV